MTFDPRSHPASQFGLRTFPGNVDFSRLQGNKSDGTKFKPVDERQSFELGSVQVRVKNVSKLSETSLNWV